MTATTSGAALVPHDSRKVPLADAARMLTSLCDAIDQGEDLSQALVQVFSETKLDLAEAVDRRIAFDTWIKGAVAAAKQARDEWASRARQLENIHEVFKEKTQDIVEAFPDLPYEGHLGRIAVQKGPPSLFLGFDSNAVTPEVISMFGVDPKYVKTVTTYKIDTAMVKDDLKAGVTLSWAEMKQSSHLRFRK